MKRASIPLILGSILIAMWYFALPPERPGFMIEPSGLALLFGGPSRFIQYYGPAGLGTGFLVAGSILVITGLLLATLPAVERGRRASAEVGQAPIKNLFPLVTWQGRVLLAFIFAALFIVILSPAIISIMINLRS
jgi:hypothetical protein